MRASLSSFARPPVDRRALRGYRRERVTELTVPVALALMEGGFVGVVADKVYHVHPAVLAVITAAPMFGNLSSFAWARLARGRRKVPLVTGLQAAMVGLIALTSLAPEGALGATVLVGSMVAVRLMLSGAITIRSTIWSLNYPREVRARYTGRLQLLTSFTLAASSFVASLALDANPENFRLMYGFASLVAVAGVIAFAGVPHIGEDEHLGLERGHTAQGGEKPAPTRSMWSVLRDDREFRRYQTWQFVLGVSNMMVEAPLIYLVSRQLQASYTVSVALTMTIPLVLGAATLPIWALVIDRMHIARFRARQSGFWVLSQALTWYGAAQGSLALIACGRVVLGLARGGGGLAWQLGHNDYSSPRDLAAYMGAHVTLTGVRGAFAPFLGMLLFLGSGPVALPGVDWTLPALPGLGAHSFGVSCALSSLSALGFILLARKNRV